LVFVGDRFQVTRSARGLPVSEEIVVEPGDVVELIIPSR
jgi:hypothetical protein